MSICSLLNYLFEHQYIPKHLWIECFECPQNANHTYSLIVNLSSSWYGLRKTDRGVSSTIWPREAPITR